MSKIIKNCLVCSKEFSPKRYTIAEGNGKYCGVECFKFKIKSHPIERTCLYCNKIFYIKKKQANRGEGIYCSASCSTAHRNKKKAKAPIEIFLSNIIITANECWEYQVKGNSLYGKMTINGKDIRAHRFSYEHHTGPIPEGYLVCHKCDNPPCCNPEHLFIGTSKDNTQDMLQKGRGRKRPK